MKTLIILSTITLLFIACEQETSNPVIIYEAEPDVVNYDSTDSPHITSATLMDGGVNVPIDGLNKCGIRISFDESIAGFIYLKDATGRQLKWVTVIRENDAWLIPRIDKLENGKTYTLVVDVEDGVGNKLVETITFKTIE